MDRPVSRRASSMARAYAAARLSRMDRTSAARPSGTGSPAAVSHAAIRAGMSPGVRKDASSGSKVGPSPLAAPQRRRAAPRAAPARPPRSQARCDSWSSHSPVTLRRNRDRPVDPALVGEVRLPARLGEDRRPRLDAHQRPRPGRDVCECRAVRGDATTADAVSCDPTSVTTVVSCSPVASRTAGSTPPRTVPGSASGGNSVASSPSSRTSSSSQPRVRGSSRPVVDACVRSAITTPVSQ